MTTRPGTYWTRSERAGLTLVEVVTATLLLGTLLVSTLMAYGRHTGQFNRSQRRLQVINALDDKIAEWYLTRRGVPAAESGTLLRTQTAEIRWQTRVLPDAGLRKKLLSQVVRVEAIESDGKVLTFVDILQEASP